MADLLRGLHAPVYNHIARAFLAQANARMQPCPCPCITRCPFVCKFTSFQGGGWCLTLRDCYVRSRGRLGAAMRGPPERDLANVALVFSDNELINPTVSRVECCCVLIHSFSLSTTDRHCWAAANCADLRSITLGVSTQILQSMHITGRIFSLGCC